MNNEQQPIATEQSPEKNPFKIATIMLSVVVLGLAGLSVFQLLNKDNQHDNVANSRTTSEESKSETPKTNTPTNEKQQQIAQPDNANYLELPKIGMKIPMSKDVTDQLSLAEVDNGYRLDIKVITDYRKQGYCGNGGSSAIGIITKNSIEISKPVSHPTQGAQPRKSGFFGTTLTEFNNDVIYPNSYITFTSTDAACWDLGNGGTARGQEVSKQVQKLNDALADALKNIKLIN